MKNIDEIKSEPAFCDVYDDETADLLDWMFQEWKIDQKTKNYLLENADTLKPLINTHFMDLTQIITATEDLSQDDLVVDIIDMTHKDPSSMYKILKSVKEYKKNIESIEEWMPGSEATNEEIEAFKQETLELLKNNVRDFGMNVQIAYDTSRPWRWLYQSAYDFIWLTYDSSWIDKKLEENSMWDVIGKWIVDELLWMTHLMNLDITNIDQLKTIFSFIAENRKSIAKDFVGSWTDIFHIASMKWDTIKQYEFWRSLMQRILFAIPIAKIWGMAWKAWAKVIKGVRGNKKIKVPKVVSSSADFLGKALYRSIESTYTVSIAFKWVDKTLRDYMKT